MAILSQSHFWRAFGRLSLVSRVIAYLHWIFLHDCLDRLRSAASEQRLTEAAQSVEGCSAQGVLACDGACLLHAGIFVSAAGGPASSPMYHASAEHFQEMLAAAKRNNGQRWPSDDFPHSIMRTGSDGYRFTDDACELARVSANDLQVRHRVHHGVAC